MAEEQRNTQVPMQETFGETKDRGMFGFNGKREEEKPQEHISSELGHKENKPSLLEKLHGSNSSSSSEEEVEGEGGMKIRRKKEKKGLTEKIKEKFTGEKDEAEKKEPIGTGPTPACATVEGHEGEDKENKGMLEKIKEKIPGMHSKTEDDKKDCEKNHVSH